MYLLLSGEASLLLRLAPTSHLQLLRMSTAFVAVRSPVFLLAA
jgi:hypothetical protein